MPKAAPETTPHPTEPAPLEYAKDPAAIGGRLGQDESLLWSEQPRQGKFLCLSDAFLIPVGTLFFGGPIAQAAIVVSMAGMMGGSVVSMVPFLLFDLVFAAFGAYLAIGRLWVDACRRKKTHYAVTSDRVMIVSGLFSTKVRSFDIRNLPPVSISDGADGRGTIRFGKRSLMWWMTYGLVDFPGLPWPFSMHARPALEQIEGAREVYEMILAARANVGPDVGSA